MSKRYNRLPIHTSSAKRHKTDIQENGVTIQSSSRFNFKTTIPSSKPITKVPSMSALSDDDHDDLLVYVTSQLEQQVKSVVPEIAPPGMSESFSSVFAAGMNLKTSTQMFVQHGKVIPEAKNDFNGWDDDGDFLLSQFNIDENMAQLAKQKEETRLASMAKPSTSKVDADVFKVPGQVPAYQPDRMEQSMILPSQMTVSEEARSNLQQRRQRANELKIKCLEDHVEKLKASKKKVEEKVTITEQKIKTQETEINTLKYELKRLKQMLEGLRQDKLRDSEKINKEWSERMTELENKLKVCQLELQQKSVEIMNVQMKPNTSKPNNEMEVPKIDVSDIYAMCQQMYTVPKSPITINSLIFKEIDDKHFVKREICVKEYDALTMGLSKLLISDAPNPTLIRQVIPTVKTVLRLIYRYALKLNRTNPTEYQFVPLAEVKLLAATITQNRPLKLSEFQPHKQPTVFDACENVREEKAFVARRCLAVIAEMCRSKAFVEIILNDPMNFLKKLNLIVQIIGASDEYAEYSALIAAMTTIAINVYVNSRSFKTIVNDKLIFQFMKSIVHCRIMNIVTLHKISEMLQSVSSQQDKHVLAYFCTKNCDMLQKSDLASGIVRFTYLSCPLQVFGACLETSIRYNNGPLNGSQIQLTAEMVINISHFLTTCEDQQVPWIYQPPVGDQTPICPCMPKLICGFIQILAACLREFRSNPAIIAMKTMSYLAKAAVVLLGRTFEQYEQYQIDIFTYGCGSLLAVKSSFKIAVSILNKYQVELEFEPIQGK